MITIYRFYIPPFSVLEQLQLQQNLWLWSFVFDLFYLLFSHCLVPVRFSVLERPELSEVISVLPGLDRILVYLSNSGYLYLWRHEQGRYVWLVEVLLYVHRNRRFIRDGSPERPPRLSHRSWGLVYVWRKHTAEYVQFCWLKCVSRCELIFFWSSLFKEQIKVPATRGTHIRNKTKTNKKQKTQHTRELISARKT